MFDYRLTKEWTKGALPDATLIVPQNDQLGFLSEHRSLLSDSDILGRENANSAIRSRLSELGIPQLGRVLRNEGIITDYKNICGEDAFDSLVEALMNAVEHGTNNLRLSNVTIEIYKSTNPPMIVIENLGQGFPFEHIGKREFGMIRVDDIFRESDEKPAIGKATRGTGLPYLFNYNMTSGSSTSMTDKEGRSFNMSGCIFRVNFERFDEGRGFRTILEYSHS